MFSALPQCADRDTKWIFSVDTFTLTESTHRQNSNKPATRPKVHISRLKVKYSRLLNSKYTFKISYRQLFVTLQPSIRKCTFISYFYFIIKRLSFLNCHRLTYGFSFGMHSCKPLIHLVQLQSIRISRVLASGLKEFYSNLLKPGTIICT